MKKFSHLWQYLAELFLEWELFKKNSVERNEKEIFVQ
jgi:hypothetical protein